MAASSIFTPKTSLTGKICRRVRTHKKNSGDAGCGLGTMIQSMFYVHQRWEVQNREELGEMA